MQHELGNRLTRFRQWAKGLVVQDVPEDIAVCEFDCRKGQCKQDEWEKCERRLTKAAGELSPGTRQSRPTDR